MSMHQLLQEFTRLMAEHDLMKLGGAPDEYESEALSVLSRFNESALHMCEDADDLTTISRGIVRQAFEFWFAEESPDVSQLTSALVAAFLASYAQREQQAAVEVHSDQ